MTIYKKPQRLINEFGFDATVSIKEYCRDNYVNIPSTGDIDVCIGGFERWLAENDFEIVDKRPTCPVKFEKQHREMSYKE